MAQLTVVSQSGEKAKPQNPADRKFLSLAVERFQRCVEAESMNRRDSLDDLQFSVGEQWPSDIAQQRQQDSRPCLTMNRLPQFIRMITNEQRQQRPAIKVNPAGDGGSVEVAQVYGGMIRHIETSSDAEIAYDTGFDGLVRVGFGYWRILTQYVSEDSFDQELKIARIKNPFRVYFDPNAQEPDYSDAEYCFIFTDMSLQQFKAAYPNSSAAKDATFMSTGDMPPNWGDKENIRVAEYFYADYEDTTLHLMADGSTKTALAEGEQSVKQKIFRKRIIKWAKITAIEKLEETVWPGKFIPVIPALADDIDVNGRRYLAGLVRNAKDPQRMYNYWISSATETIALAPRAPFIAAEGQLEGHETEWQMANQRNFPFLLYKVRDVAGQPVPPPQRQTYEPPIQAMSMMIKQADNDLKATTGIYDAALGERGPDESGRAILLRKKQTDVSTLNFSDNMARAIRFTGRVLVDLIPKIYDAPRVQRIVKPDGTTQHVGIHNSSVSELRADGTAADGQLDSTFAAVQRIYDIGTGRYDVVVDIGPSYQTKRQESAESMMALVQSYPAIMQIAGDLMIRNMDWPGAEQIADRMKMSLPPNLLMAESDEDPKVQVQKLTGALNQLSQQHMAVTAELNKAMETISTNRIEIESKERIAAMNNQTQVVTTQAKILGEGALKVLQQQMDTITARLELLHNNLTLEKEAELTPQPATTGM